MTPDFNIPPTYRVETDVLPGVWILWAPDGWEIGQYATGDVEWVESMAWRHYEQEHSQDSRRQPDGNLKVRVGGYIEELDTFVDGFTEISPDHPDYEKHLADVERQEAREREEQQR